MKPKVFCIGFHKTGTTSLELALKKLGYRVTGSFGTKDPDIASKVHAMVYAMVDGFDAFENNPWPVLYQELDQRYPGSKFILTRRPVKAWHLLPQREKVLPMSPEGCVTYVSGRSKGPFRGLFSLACV